jgi:hypothetical protein
VSGLADSSPQHGLYGFPEDVRRSAIFILHYYDNVGAMVAHKLIAPDIVLSVLGESVDRFWNQIEPFLSAERDIRGDNEYEIFFEHLAAMAADSQGRAARAKLNLLRRPMPTAVAVAVERQDGQS